MKRFSSIFSQLLQLFPRLEFETAVRDHRAERHARGFASWSQFIAMLFCQLGRAHSLREICGGLASVEGKLRHLGLQEAPKRSTLAYANRHRPWQLYQTVFGQLLEKCQGVVAQRGGKTFRFKEQTDEPGRQRDRPVRCRCSTGRGFGGPRGRSSCTCYWITTGTCPRLR